MALESTKIYLDIQPPIITVKENHLFAYHAALNPKDGTIYVDFTGKFLKMSMKGNTIIFLLYNWSSNAILATLMKYLKDESTIATFKGNIT